MSSQFASRIAIAPQTGQVELERTSQSRTALPPFVEQRPKDVHNTQLAKHSRIGALVHQRQSVADCELVHAEFAVALTNLYVLDDRVDQMKLTTVGDKPHRDRHTNEQLR
ncbi:hypothetical protein ABD05_01895 [Burkholderia pyrrocinia]|nr:hypothetical protein ABD05_01895 [Burkholderia pyrrocinia]